MTGDGTGDGDGVVTREVSPAAALEARLRSISPAESPDQWALAAYRLAVALGEDSSPDRELSLHQAAQLLERAARLLDAQRAPIEHARILNAAGATWRALGSTSQAVDAFAAAASLLSGRARDGEIGSVLSNLGLAQLERGDGVAALRTFDEALGVLRRALTASSGPQEKRAFASAALNRAQALLALPDGTAPDGHAMGWGPDVSTAAISTVEEGLAVSSVADAPLQVGMLRHTLGLIRMRADQPDAARDDFTGALAVFTRTSFPFQHAIANFNRGRASEQAGDLRGALVDYETAAQLFDPRLHRDQWHEAATRLANVERQLMETFPDATRSDHIVGLLADANSAARLAMLRERIGRLWTRSPDVARAELRQLAQAAIRLSLDARDEVLRATIEVFMELPDEVLRSGLQAQLDAHAALPEPERLAADRRFDTAIQELVMGPQRVRMRDILYETGWERP